MSDIGGEWRRVEEVEGKVKIYQHIRCVGKTIKAPKGRHK
jgi:hypothetical protein